MKLFQCFVSKLFQPSSTSVWNNFISARGNLPEIISQLSHTIIAAREYFETCSLPLKYFENSLGGWNNFISVSTVVTCEIKHWNNFTSFQFATVQSQIYWGLLKTWKLETGSWDETKLSCLVCSCVHTADTDKTRHDKFRRCEHAIRLGHTVCCPYYSTVLSTYKRWHSSVNGIRTLPPIYVSCVTQIMLCFTGIKTLYQLLLSLLLLWLLYAGTLTGIICRGSSRPPCFVGPLGALIPHLFCSYTLLHLQNKLEITLPIYHHINHWFYVYDCCDYFFITLCFNRVCTCVHRLQFVNYVIN